MWDRRDGDVPYESRRGVRSSLRVSTKGDVIRLVEVAMMRWMGWMRMDEVIGCWLSQRVYSGGRIQFTIQSTITDPVIIKTLFDTPIAEVFM